MNKVCITDYITDPSIESRILGNVVLGVESDAEAILVWHEKIDENFLERLPKLKCVVRYGVGYDNLDLDALKKRNIIACNTPDYGVDEVSDTAISFILAISRGIIQYDYKLREKEWEWQRPMTNLKRSFHQQIGIVGTGRIGSLTALKLKALGFKISFFDPYVSAGHEKVLGAKRYDDLYEMLGDSDIVSLHTPLNRETTNLVDEKFLSTMKDGASLINISRGGVVTSDDLIATFLDSEKLNCFYTDVLSKEPLEDSQLIQGWREGKYQGRVCITPHSAFYSQESFLEMRESAAKTVKKIFAGQDVSSMRIA